MIMKTTSVALGPYFEDFIKAQIAQGRYNNASEVIRAGLRMLEDNDARIAALKSAIEEGMNSGEAVDFDPTAHQKSLKASKKNA
jgi:antitoxin ParD1/3/4